MSNPKSILGTGWSFPPAFSQNGAEVQMVSDEEDIRQSLQLILRTGLNERILQEDFGADLGSLLFEEVNEDLLGQVQRIVATALLRHEPRIDVEEVNARANDAVQGELLLSISYSIRGTNSRYNMVYPFYLLEGNV